MSVILGENGGLPTTGLTNGHLTLTEDGDTLTTEVYDCQISGVADIVILLDHSTSMLGIVGDRANIYERFYSSFGTFIGQLPYGARYSLLPYTDSVTANYPEQQNAQEYYRQGIKQDSIDCIAAIKSLVFAGNTNVDAAIPAGLKKLIRSGATKKIILLITDDFTHFPDSIGIELFRAGIKVFVLETGKDNAPNNFLLAQKTGGTYYQAGDTTLYAYYLQRIAENIKAEHCMLRYTTNKKCPWNSYHTVALTLDYKTIHKTNWHGYAATHVPMDTTLPTLTLSAPRFTSRIISAIEDYPCERGLMSFTTTTLTNFTRYVRSSQYPYTTSDSLEVTDPLLRAEAFYIAIDSAGNSSTKSCSYFPISDTTSIQPLVFSSDIINFGRKEAPTDTSISFTLVNPNTKPVTIRSIISSGNTSEIDIAIPSLTFEPLEVKTITTRFTSALLGDYRAKFVLQGDTSDLGTLNVSGQTYGSIHVWIDSSTVTSVGDTGSILLRFRAKPAPINLDSLIVTLNYDSDLIDFIIGRIELPNSSPLSSYTMSASAHPGGKFELKFTRGSESLPITIDSANAYILLQLRTYSAKNRVSVISVDSYVASFGSLLSSTQGLLSVNDGCGDSLMRVYLNDKNSLKITNIFVNDASQLEINYNSITEGDTKIVITDILGRTIYSENLLSKGGLNIFTIDKSIAVGSYIISIQSQRVICTMPFAIIR